MTRHRDERIDETPDETGDVSADGPADPGGQDAPDDGPSDPVEGTEEPVAAAREDEVSVGWRDRAEASAKRADDLREQLLRTAADFDNYRKRLERERVEEKKHAATSLVRQLLPVADSLHRALEQAKSAGPEATSLSAFVDGLCLIEAQFFDILKAAGLQVIEAKGQPFDPSLHEAMLQEPSTAPHMTVLDVLETGYLFNGRLLRPARVKVAFNPEGRETDDGEARDDEPATGEAE